MSDKTLAEKFNEAADALKRLGWAIAAADTSNPASVRRFYARKLTL